MTDDPYMALLGELAGLAIAGARQSAAIASLLIAKGVATQEELDEYMRSTAQTTKNLEDLMREIEALPERDVD